MDSNRIQRLAAGARDALVKGAKDAYERVTRRESDERLAAPADVVRLEALARQMGTDKLAEQVAYTWFNRLCALRFMDAHGYTLVGIVTPRPGESMPAVLADARRGSVCPGLGMRPEAAERVTGLLSGAVGSLDALNEAYVALLLAACDLYAAPMGYLFGGEPDMRCAMRLMAPAGLLAEGSVLSRIVEGMDEESCADVEVLGWLYQFYVKERKDAWFASKKKATADDLAPATQLFTPDWIVRYLVENSLGRLWMLNNPGSELASKMDYYVAPGPGEAEEFLRVSGPEELTVCDPACGSGHILVCAFRLLFDIYEEEGYRPEDIPELILTNNIRGMEIDRRAAEIAMFALEMCAREKDPSWFDKGIDAKVTVLEPVRFDERELDDAGLIGGNARLLDAFGHLDEVGSLYVPDGGDMVLVDNAIENVRDANGMFAGATLAKLGRMKGILETLAGPYACVVANPPYIQSSKLDPWMSAWVKKTFPNEKGDLCTCFIRRGFSLACEYGYNAMVTMHSWMFLGSYEKMRGWLLASKRILGMAHLGPRAFEQIGGEVVQVTATSFWNGRGEGAGDYVRLVDYDNPADKESALREAAKDPACAWRHHADQSDFSAIPGTPIAYWASESLLAAFRDGTPLKEISEPKQGLATADNKRFLRLWWEPRYSGIGFGYVSREDAKQSHLKWFPMTKGGEFRRWYGNLDYVANWEDDGREIRNFVVDGKLKSRPQNLDSYFKPGLSWSAISSGLFAMRRSDCGIIPNAKGPSCVFPTPEKANYLLAASNTSAFMKMLEFISPTLDYSQGPLSRVPVPTVQDTGAEALAEENVSLSRTDWDSFETSWDFMWHPLAPSNFERMEQFGANMNHEARAKSVTLISDRFRRWSDECEWRFQQLKSNEEELNRIFARIYGMEGEVPIEVPDDKVSVRRADLVRDVKSLVSYGVGCIFGRYSTYKKGLVLADAQQTAEDFRAKVPDAGFLPDGDNVLPVLTEVDDFTYKDEIVRSFRSWLADTYGEETLAENVQFIEGALGKDLRTYFARDFYKDHCDTYQVTGSGKRPIYWMFSSPKGGFQALVYMHRMNADTVGLVLTRYVRPYRQWLETEAGSLDATGQSRDAAKANKYRQMAAELVAWERDVLYPLSQKRVEIDLDDGVKANYPKFAGALAKVQGLS
ncbi:BREX-1 system adenine-specific DNA-methyltransferase PglX [Paratractidigestivibacter sp.]|uniref:BREX-1 system adenine-specific DNA-methyltransferase PglX n=1 Tax=Paratractidigestivibacter sp. TaxID=2847316 RepID=UPI002ACB14F3|nr:BREX-1 system adenine-specific DNA-methyltransferase PglX [Paratractidigestivibacter sp.]